MRRMDKISSGFVLTDGGPLAGRAASLTRSAAKKADGIVYERTNPLTGECYIGQCKSSARFNARQKEHDRELGVQHDFEIQGRADPGEALDVLEETTIRKKRGIKKRGGNLENKRHQMSEERYRTAGGSEDSPY